MKRIVISALFLWMSLALLASQMYVVGEVVSSYSG